MEETRGKALAIVRRFLDRNVFRNLIRQRDLTAQEAMEGLYSSEFFFGPHHRNIAPVGLHKIVTNPTLGYEALPIPKDAADGFMNVYRTVEVEPGVSKPLLCEGVLLLATGGSSNPVVVELVREENGLLLRAWTRSENANQGRDLVEAVRIYCLRNNAMKGRKIDGSGRFISIGKYTWDDLILPQATKRFIIESVANFVEKLSVYRKYGLKTKRGFLFSGVPGTGKTLSGKVLACQTSATFIWVTSQDLADVRNVREVFRMARDLAPSIIYLEDADLYAMDRKTGNRSAVLGEVMNQLDGLEDLEDVITVMTTNYPEKLERALIDRPGRFDQEVRFEYPDEAMALAMVRRFAASWRIQGSSNSLDNELGQILGGLSGAHIYEAVKRAAIVSIDAGPVGPNGVVIPMAVLLSSAKDVRREHEEKARRFDEAVPDIPDTPQI